MKAWTTTVRTPQCVVCGKVSYITVETIRLRWWQDEGMHIQRAFPDLSPDVREVMISGTHPKCWDVLFPEEDDE